MAELTCKQNHSYPLPLKLLKINFILTLKIKDRWNHAEKGDYAVKSRTCMICSTGNFIYCFSRKTSYCSRPGLSFIHKLHWAILTIVLKKRKIHKNSWHCIASKEPRTWKYPIKWKEIYQVTSFFLQMTSPTIIN